MATILLADDGSALARRAHEASLKLFSHDHQFVLLAVVTPSLVPSATLSPMDASHVAIPNPEVSLAADNLERENLQESLTEAVKALGISAETRVEIGDPATVICEVADELDAKAIVMGSHGHGLFTRVFVGSVSTQVLRNSHRPVLILPRAT